MHCLIIDNNLKTATDLQQLLEADTRVSKVYYAVEPYLVRSLMTQTTIDIVFIRMRLWEFMPFKELSRFPAMVFISGGKDKLTQRPESSVQFAIWEPLRALDLSKLLTRVQTTITDKSFAFFFLRYNGRFHKTRFSDIEMIEKREKNYMQFHLSYENPLIAGSPGYWLQKLPKDQFVRISDTLIVPVSELPKIRGNEYIYRGRKIPLSFRFAAGSGDEMTDWPDGL